MEGVTQNYKRVGKERLFRDETFSLLFVLALPHLIRIFLTQADRLKNFEEDENLLKV